jgi:hypothetical protein
MKTEPLFSTIGDADWGRSRFTFFPMKTHLASSLLGIALLAPGCTSSANRTSEAVANVVAVSAATTPEAKKIADVQKDGTKDARIREAYELGQLQATKALHAAIQNTQKTDAADAGAQDLSLVPLTVPERTIDGVIINQGVEYVRLPR